jgi:hypothetical protein
LLALLRPGDPKPDPFGNVLLVLAILALLVAFWLLFNVSKRKGR